MTPINIFDFDGTLTSQFWPMFLVWVDQFGYDGTFDSPALERDLTAYRAAHPGPEIVTFFDFFDHLLRENHAALTFADLMRGEPYIKYNPHLLDYLKTSTAKNYIVSTGFQDYLTHLQIFQYFDGAYGTTFDYDDQGRIAGVDQILTNDGKIQAIRDILKKNDREPDDCRNVIYVGDGYTDAPSMRFVHENGGKAIFVYQPGADSEVNQNSAAILRQLQKEGVVDYDCVADYDLAGPLAHLLRRE